MELPIAEAEVIWRAELPPTAADATALGRYWHVRKGELAIDLPGVARYRVIGGKQIEVALWPGGDRSAAEFFLMSTPFGALIHQRGEFAFHASAVVSPANGKALLIAGVSGAGKSTAAAALAQRGWTVINDDICRITLEANEPAVWPGFTSLKLWRQSCRLLNLQQEGLSRTRGGKEKYFWCPEDHAQDGRGIGPLPEEPWSVSPPSAAGVRALCASEDHAQDGRGIGPPPEEPWSVSPPLAAGVRALCASEDHAQDGRGIGPPPEEPWSVSPPLAAGVRALCASEDHAQDGRGIGPPPEEPWSVSPPLAAGVRALCASEDHAQDGRGIGPPPEEPWSVSPPLAAGVRALCASEDHAQDGRGIGPPPKELRSVSLPLAAGVRALCAGKKPAKRGCFPIGAVLELVPSPDAPVGPERLTGRDILGVYFFHTFRRQLVSGLGCQLTQFQHAGRLAASVPTYRLTGNRQLDPAHLANELEKLI